MAFFNVLDTYNYFITEKADSRTTNLLLIGSPVPIIFIIAAYISFVKVLGPKLMEHRKPFDIDRLLVYYNACQMIMNTYICYQSASVMFRTFNLHCNEIDYSDNPDSVQLLFAAHNYFLTKIIDLLDTVFFVMRKKQTQITFLHVYHHAAMVSLTWIGSKYYGGGHAMFVTAINAFVHVVMYGYYLVTVWNKELRQNHTIKRRITELQLIQFSYGFYICLAPLLNGCNYPHGIIYLGLSQNIIFIWLFANFYFHAYLKKKGNDKQHFD